MAQYHFQRDTVVGVFHDLSHAQTAVRELRDAGFSETDIGLVAHDKDGHGQRHVEQHGSLAAEGAATGAAAGAGVGALWAVGIAAGLLPAIGPIVAGGIFGSLLASAAAGAAVAGLAGALVGLGVPEDEANYYESEFGAGRTIVTVKAGSRRHDAWAILHRNDAYDMETGGAPA